MVKKFVNIVFAVYISFMVVLGSYGIPIFIHSCQLSQQFDIHLTAGNGEDPCGDSEKMHAACSKVGGTCCTLEKKIVKADFDHFPPLEVQEYTISLPVVAMVEFGISFVSIQKNKPVYEANAPPIISGKALRYRMQSILC